MDCMRFLRQMRLTRLKNDLVATVSHELKTPLASIRLLVDTLLSGDCGAGVPPAGSCGAGVSPAGSCGAGVSPAGSCGAGVSPALAAGTAAPQDNNPTRTREYLELIAKENARLSR